MLFRSSANPIIGRDALSTSNSVFNSAVVPFKKGKYNYAGVFRCDDTNRRMRIHAGLRDYAKKNGISSEDIDKWLAQDGKKPPLFIKGNSIEEAAKKAGINPKNLLDTVEKYNSYVVNKDDKDFHRPVKFMTKTIDVSGPFYIVEDRKSTRLNSSHSV